MDNSISFGATHLRTTRIKKYMILPKTAHIVELNPHDKADIIALKEVKKSWRFGDVYGRRIIKNFINRYKKERHPEGFRLLALTTQSSNFEKLESEKILGLAEISQKPNCDWLELEYLQGRPDTNYNNSIIRKYKRVGTALLNYIKSQFSKIRLVADMDALEFYKINGFVEQDGCSVYHVWTR